MRFFDGYTHRRAAAVTAAALGGAALLVGVLPSRGQQGTPSAHLRQLTRIPRRPVGVAFDYSLPRGHTLVAPYVRVTDSGGKTLEWLPAFVAAATPGTAFRELHSSAYRPGKYLVRAEVNYLDPAGQPGTAVSDVTTLTIPGP